MAESVISFGMVRFVRKLNGLSCVLVVPMIRNMPRLQLARDVMSADTQEKDAAAFLFQSSSSEVQYEAIN